MLAAGDPRIKETELYIDYLEADLPRLHEYPVKEDQFQITVMGKTYTAKLSEDILGNITRINNVLERIPQKLKEYREDLAQLKKEFESAGQEAGKRSVAVKITNGNRAVWMQGGIFMHKGGKDPQFPHGKRHHGLWGTGGAGRKERRTV